ncbi:hypothetical protein Tco_1392717 [Tanacetum coccineum]
MNVAVQLQTNKLREEAQAENQDFLNQVDSTMKTIIKDQVKAQVSKIMPKIEKYVTESMGAKVLVRSTNQPQTAYVVAASLSEFELKKILIDKMEANKSINRSDNQKNIYNALVESYNSDKDIITSYGDSVHVEEPSHTIEDLGMQQDQEFVSGDNDEQPANKETWISQAVLAEEPHASFDEFNDTSFDFSTFVLNRLKILNLTHEFWLDRHSTCSKHNPENKLYLFNLRKPLLLIQDHQGRQIIPKDYFINKDLEYMKGGDLSRRYSTSVTKTKAATYELNGSKTWFTNCGVSLRRIVAVTRLTIMKKYDYGHLEEIEVRQDDQQLYTFKEGDFKRLRLQDIKDMLLLLVQQKLTNLTIDEQPNLWNRTAYTSYSDPHRIIYVDQFKRKRLMRTDELYKSSDGTLNDVRTALHDIAARIRMEYLPMRKWSNLDKKRARFMVQDIDNQLY